MWTAPSAAPESSTSPGKLMMIGWATPTVEPLAGTILGGPNGAAPVNGAGFCPAPGSGATPGSPGGGSASAGPTPSVRTSPNIDATPTAFRAADRLPLVQPDIDIPPVASSEQSRITPGDAFFSSAGRSASDAHAGVQNPLRVQRVFDAAVQRHRLGSEIVVQPGPLQPADAMLAGDR